MIPCVIKNCHLCNNHEFFFLENKTFIALLYQKKNTFSFAVIVSVLCRASRRLINEDPEGD